MKTINEITTSQEWVPLRQDADVNVGDIFRTIMTLPGVQHSDRCDCRVRVVRVGTILNHARWVLVEHAMQYVHVQFSAQHGPDPYYGQGPAHRIDCDDIVELDPSAPITGDVIETALRRGQTVSKYRYRRVDDIVIIDIFRDNEESSDGRKS